MRYRADSECSLSNAAGSLTKRVTNSSFKAHYYRPMNNFDPISRVNPDVFALSADLTNANASDCQTADQKLKVYYDGACPLCQKEIRYYQRKDTRNKISWIDLTHSDEQALGPDLDKEAALRRFHARSPSGELYSGGRAFTEVWLNLPGFHALGKLSSTRLMGGALEHLYRGFLLVRPFMQRILRSTSD